MRRLATLAAVAVLAALALAACSSAAPGERTVTVNHGPVPAPVYVDLGDTGGSPGDMRLFHYEGTSGNDAVLVDVVMATTGIVPGATDEYRDTRIIFTWPNPADQLILEGIGVYPGAGSVLKVAATVIRPVIGGSGAYAGASGWVASTHNADDTWTHVFHIH